MPLARSAGFHGCLPNRWARAYDYSIKVLCDLTNHHALRHSGTARLRHTHCGLLPKQRFAIRRSSPQWLCSSSTAASAARARDCRNPEGAGSQSKEVAAASSRSSLRRRNTESVANFFANCLKGSKLRDYKFAKIKSNFIESVFSEAQGLGSCARNISAEAQPPHQLAVAYPEILRPQLLHPQSLEFHLRDKRV